VRTLEILLAYCPESAVDVPRHSSRVKQFGAHHKLAVMKEALNETATFSFIKRLVFINQL
jgi:hypothetical protein